MHKSFCLLLAFPLLGLAQTYPLACQAGPSLRLSFELNSHGMKGQVLVGSFQASPLAGTAGPGQCTWLDRPLNPAEPRAFCVRSNENDLRVNGVQEVIGALAITGGTATLNVSNNNAGCMVVASVQSAGAASGRITGGVNIPNLGARLQGSIRPPVLPGRGCGKCDSNVGGGTLPRPPVPSGTALNRLERLNSELLSIAQRALTSGDFAQLQSTERSDCGNDVYCQLDLRSAAIAIGLGVQ